MKIIKPTTIARAADDLKTLVDWLEDLSARKARAEICEQSSVGLSDERRADLVHEGRSLLRAFDHLIKRWEGKRDGR